MGLTVSVMIPSDTSWRSSYSNFNRFREVLAESSGTVLVEMVGYGGPIPWSGEEPFYELLDHPDNTGEIYDIESLSDDFNNKEYHEKFIELVEKYDQTEYINAWKEWEWMLAVADTEGGILHFK